MSHDREPVRHTCPDVDAALDHVSSSSRVLSDVEDALRSIGRLLEDLRKSNEKLREWGCEEADRVDELKQDIEDLKSDHRDEVTSLADDLSAALERARAAEDRVAELETETA